VVHSLLRTCILVAVAVPARSIRLVEDHIALDPVGSILLEEFPSVYCMADIQHRRLDLPRVLEVEDTANRSMRPDLHLYVGENSTESRMLVVRLRVRPLYSPLLEFSGCRL